MKLISTTTNLRSRWFQLPYGDQAIFMHAQRLHEIGGFPDLPVMEDLKLIQRLKRCGHIRLIPDRVTTSARRWHLHGIWRMTLLNQVLILAYNLGYPPSLLWQWRESGRLFGYRRVRK